MSTIIPDHQVTSAKISEILSAAFYEVGDISSNDGSDVFSISEGDLHVPQYVLVDPEEKNVKLFILFPPPKNGWSRERAISIANKVNSDVRGDVCMFVNDDSGIVVCKLIPGKKGLNPHHIIEGVRNLNKLFNAVFEMELVNYYK